MVPYGGGLWKTTMAASCGAYEFVCEPLSGQWIGALDDRTESMTWRFRRTAPRIVASSWQYSW